MKVNENKTFTEVVKKLHPNQKKDLDKAVKVIIADPNVGDLKAGDLSGISVYKFKMVNQLSLLAYTYSDKTITLTLLKLGSHENFYRDLKKIV